MQSCIFINFLLKIINKLIFLQIDYVHLYIPSDFVVCSNSSLFCLLAFHLGMKQWNIFEYYYTQHNILVIAGLVQSICFLLFFLVIIFILFLFMILSFISFCFQPDPFGFSKSKKFQTKRIWLKAIRNKKEKNKKDRRIQQILVANSNQLISKF